MTVARPCWCGNADLLPFNTDYLRCTRCETLVLQRETSAAAGRVEDDDKDFYGRDYWVGHQEELGFTDIRERARHDMPRRCVHWLRTVLRYRLPPGVTLELGCAHGGFVAMLRSAGFDARGLELSPSVAEFATRTFGVPMLTGPVEDQAIRAESMDLMLAMDVLEHFSDPLETVRHCAGLLQPHGMFIFQTPSYPEGMSFEDMHAHQSPFLEQLRPQEHMYLFSRTSVRALFERVGFGHVAFEPAMFAQYDMFVVASRAPLAPLPEVEAVSTLTSTTAARLLLALVDLDRELTGANTDREARLDQVHTLDALLQEASADRKARLGQVQTLDALLREANADRDARLTQIHELGHQLEEANADREARLGQVHTLDALLREANADREARLDQVHTLDALLQGANADRTARLDQVHALDALLKEANADRTARLDQVHALGALVHEIRLEREQQGAVKQQLEQLFETTRDMLVATRAETEALRTRLATVPGPTAPHRALSLRRKASPDRPLVAIDVTPVLPGSENGGAKGLVLALLDGFAARGRHRYLLLTTPLNHDSFAGFERTAMMRSRLVGGAVDSAAGHGVLGRLWHGRPRVKVRGPLGAAGAKLLFCPMTDPAHAEPGMPAVCTVYDLQHLEYPDFFTDNERANREASLNRVKNVVSLVVCISEFTRREVIGRLGLVPERVRAIPIAIHRRLAPPSAEAVQQMRARLSLGEAPYAFYPANGWPHKNHQLLLAGFAQLITERPDLPLHLVLAGNLLDLGPGLQEAVTRMGLARRVHLVGFVSDEELAELWRGAFCLLCPSLYEGFGIPLLEAMQFGTPIVCSHAASLPEVGGEAARYIDPRRPGDISAALQELYDQPELRRVLIERGGRRLVGFQTADMVDRYLDVIDEVLSGGGYAPAASVEGVFGDRWLGPVVTALAGASQPARVWDFEMNLPDWHPHPAATVQADLDGRRVRTLRLARGETSHLMVDVPPSGGQVRLRVSPSFVPRDNGDLRELTVQLVRGQLRESKTGEVIHEV